VEGWIRAPNQVYRALRSLKVPLPFLANADSDDDGHMWQLPFVVLSRMTGKALGGAHMEEREALNGPATGVEVSKPGFAEP
jgi:hypothetical protein